MKKSGLSSERPFSNTPVNDNEINDLCQCSDAPGKCVEQIQGLDRMEVGKYGVDPDDTEYTGAQDDHDSRNDRLAKPPGSCNGTVHKCRNAVGERHNRETDDTCFYHLTVICEQGQERITEEVKGTSQYQTDRKGIKQGDEVAFQNPVLFMGTVILGDKAGTGRINGSHQIIEKRICILCGGISLHHDMVKGVDTGLYKKIGYRKDRILKSSGYADGKNTFYFIPCQAKGRQGDAEGTVCFQEQAQDQKGRNILGADTGNGNTGHIQSAHDHKKQVQDYIEDPGKGQIV